MKHHFLISYRHPAILYLELSKLIKSYDKIEGIKK